MKLVSVHVPKTGGTALRQAIETAYRLRTYYYQYRGNGEMIHGHLPVSRARADWPDVPVVAFVRHPYEQIRSHYDHYLRGPDTDFEPGIGRLPHGLTFEQFIVHPKMANYQSRFVDGPVDFLGTTERLADGVAEINRRWGLQIPVPDVVGAARRRTRLTGRHMRLIDLHHAGDLAMYEAVT